MPLAFFMNHHGYNITPMLPQHRGYEKVLFTTENPQHGGGGERRGGEERGEAAAYTVTSSLDCARNNLIPKRLFIYNLQASTCNTIMQEVSPFF